MAQLVLLLAPGAAPDDAGAAVERALAAGGLRVTSGPTESGEIVAAQLAAGPPWPEAVTWAASATGLVVHVYPGASAGLKPDFARTLSAELGGLVIAMEAARTRERYLLGSFLAGRTIELTVCDGGVVTGPAGHRICDSDEVLARFTNWTGGADVRRLGLIGAAGLFASGEAVWPAEPPHFPLNRIALAAPAPPELRGFRRRNGPAGAAVFDRDGDCDPALVTSAGKPAVELYVPGCGGDVRWRIVDENGAEGRGTVRGHTALAAAVPAWALA